MGYDTANLLRSTIGFEHLVHHALHDSKNCRYSYPSHNVEKTTDTDYTLTIAVAGFQPEDITITIEDHMLIIRGRSPRRDTHNHQRKWLHHGIATRAFERSFVLAAPLAIKEACFDNGLLKIFLQYVFSRKNEPRSISIATHPPH
ncbi:MULTISPECIES: Hsp20 family protein [unclassified Saccharibacter]|uniref:Hsp20 family protein n=1 Tax=unclassified Saccharibacter TaxID=2648722 RepID=UPI001329B8C2|nr:MULTISPECIES: Hsp20 family protein [unclassified Saccharibacter]MXV35909.1 Hsp20 family protein [Saccharibacter sp. EH611]MXV58029.1 Hsp20 family protein [Saccharibacter sp. EH70]MXV66267.1 Hsp20 family protein [Saccharibacter sp. EH60]